MAIGDVERDEQGARYVEVVFHRPGRVEAQHVGLRGSGEMARASLTTQLLDALRRRLR